MRRPKVQQEKRVMTKPQNKITELQNNMRDILGYVRMENAVLMDQGYLSLRGMYLQKMIVLKDVEEQAESLANEQSDQDIAEYLTLLSKVQKELKINAVQHLEALKANAPSSKAESWADERADLLMQQSEFKGGTA